MERDDGAQGLRLGSGFRECLLAMVLYSLAPADASAAEPLQGTEPRRASASEAVREPGRTQMAVPSLPAAFTFFSAARETPAFSPTEFRPRKPGLLETQSAHGETSFFDAPMMRDTSIARVMSESKTQDRVRLLTLWQSRASSVSLQAGKRGAPSLQWSTPWMHRDADSRGLFDRLLPVSPRAFGSGGRTGAPRQTGVNTPAKSLDLGTPLNNK